MRQTFYHAGEAIEVSVSVDQLSRIIKSVKATVVVEVSGQAQRFAKTMASNRMQAQGSATKANVRAFELTLQTRPELIPSFAGRLIQQSYIVRRSI